jgi:hypothetical protein
LVDHLPTPRARPRQGHRGSRALDSAGWWSRHPVTSAHVTLDGGYPRPEGPPRPDPSSHTTALLAPLISAQPGSVLAHIGASHQPDLTSLPPESQGSQPVRRPCNWCIGAASCSRRAGPGRCVRAVCHAAGSPQPLRSKPPLRSGFPSRGTQHVACREPFRRGLSASTTTRTQKPENKEQPPT